MDDVRAGFHLFAFHVTIEAVDGWRAGARPSWR